MEEPKKITSHGGWRQRAEATALYTVTAVLFAGAAVMTAPALGEENR